MPSYDQLFGDAPTAPASMGGGSYDRLFGWISDVGKSESRPDDTGNTVRGFKVGWQQAAPILKGAVGLVGATAEKALGEGGYATQLKEWGLKGYQEGMDKLQPLQHENDDVTVAWDRATNGDPGAMIDFVQYAFGYGMAQMAQTAAVGVASGIVGGMVSGGAAAAPAALVGVVEQSAAKGVIKTLVENEIAKRVAAGATAQAATKSLARDIGAVAGLSVMNVAQEAGQIYPAGVEQAQKDNRELTGSDIARMWGAATVAGASETIPDVIGLGAVTGRFKNLTNKLGSTRAVRTATGALAGGALESGQEAFQTVVEHYGAGQPIADEAGMNDIINSAAMALVPGVAFGGSVGFLSRRTPPGAAPFTTDTILPPPSGEPTPTTDKLIQNIANPNVGIDEQINDAARATGTLNTGGLIGSDVARAIAENAAVLPDQELRDFAISEQRDQQIRLAEQQAAQIARAEFEQNTLGTSPYDTEPVTQDERATVLAGQAEPLTPEQLAVAKPTPPREPTAIELAMQAAQERAQRDEQAWAEREAAAQQSVQQEATRAAEQAKLPQLDELPILERVIKRQTIADEELAKVVDKGFVRIRDDGRVSITESGYRARQFLLRQEAQNAQAVRSDQEEAGQGGEAGQQGVRQGAVPGGGDLQQPASRPADVGSTPGRGTTSRADREPLIQAPAQEIPGPASVANAPETRRSNYAVGGAVLQAVGEARAIQAEFLAGKGMTMEQARALPESGRAALQSEYSAWLQARQNAPGEALPAQSTQPPPKPVAPQEAAKAQPPATSTVKVGDPARIMSVDSVVARTETVGGVRYDLFNGAKMGEPRAAVRVVDQDSGNVVSVKQYPNFDMAEKEYGATVANAKKAEQPAVQESVPAAGKPVPENVLADYPDLAPRGTTPPAAAQSELAPASAAVGTKPEIRIFGQRLPDMTVAQLHHTVKHAAGPDWRAAAAAELKTRDRRGETVFGQTVDQLNDKVLAITVKKGKTKELRAAAQAEIDSRAAKVAQLTERVKQPGIPETMKALAADAGWEERGGFLIRQKHSEVAGDETISKTKWIPKAEWWPGRPVAENEQYYRAAVAKAIAGDKLTGKQAKVVEFMLDLAEHENGLPIVEIAEPEDLLAVGLPVTEVNLADENLFAAAMDQLGEDTIERLAIQHENDAEFKAAVLQLAKEKSDANQRQNAEVAQGGETGAGAEAQRPALDLASQTEADLVAKTARAHDQAAADRERIKRESEAAPGTFQLQPDVKPAAIANAEGAAKTGDLFAKPASEMTPAEHLRAAADKLDQAAQPNPRQTPAAPVAESQGGPGPERFEIGRKLTKDHKNEVLKSLGDVYRDNALEKESYVDSRGEEVWRYPYRPDLFRKSDITGAMVRHYVFLPDGKVAHPSELFPDFTQSKIDQEMRRQEDEAREKKRQAGYEADAAEKHQHDSLRESYDYWARTSEDSKKRSAGGWATILPPTERTPFTKDGKYITSPTRNSNALAELERRGWMKTNWVQVTAARSTGVAPRQGGGRADVESYSRAEPGPGLPAADIRAHIAGITEKLSVDVPVFDSVEQARLAGFSIAGDAQGFAKGDRLGLVAGNIKTLLQAETTLFHELQHVGIRRVTSDPDVGQAVKNYNAALNRVAAANPEIRHRAAAWREKYGADKRKQFEAIGVRGAELGMFLRLQSFDEAVAELAGERGGKPITRLNELIAALQRLVRALGFDELASWMESHTDAEVLSLIRQSMLAVSKDTVSFGGELAGETMQSRLDQTQTDTDIMHSRAETALGNMAGSAPLSAARNLMDDLTHSDRSINRLISKFNTPFHIAETRPEFKPIYDETQNFLHDVSRVAAEAADLAPDLLPRIEKFADFKKNPPTDADIAAVQAAVHAGTLYEGGNPLAGMKWTDDELRGKETISKPFPKGMPKLTERQISLYHQHLDSVAHSLQEHSKSLIWRLGRQARDERGQGIGLNPGDTLEVMANAARDEADRRIEDRRLQAEALIDTDTATSERLKRLNEQVRELNAFKESVTDIKNKTNNLIEHGYSPLMRFGQYAVNVASKDAKGVWHEEYFGRFDTQTAANMARKEIERDPQYRGMQITSGVMNPEMYKLFQGLNLDALQLFAEHMKDEDGTPVAKDPIMQAAFRVATAERSVMKRQIHRKGTPGYSQDLPRILSQFTTSTARSTATNYHGAAMLSAAQAIKAGDLQGYATRYVRYVNDPAEESQALRGFLANYYILGSIAFGAVNMTQPVFVTAPYLTQSTSWANAMKELGRASLDYARNGRGLNEDEAAAYERARIDGVRAPQEIHQIRAEGQASMFGDSPIWNKLSSVTQSAGIPLPSRLLMRKLSFVWGSIYSLTEQYNRSTTFLAAYRIAKANGETSQNAYDIAKKAVSATQFTYNKGNRPEVSRGNIGSVIMTFKQFNISYLELARRLYTQDKKAFAVLMLTLMALAGIDGLPFAEDIEDLLDTIGQWMGYGTNSKKRLRQTAVDILGKDIADVMLHGTSAIPGMPIDIAQRMGMHNIIPGSAVLKSSEPDKTRDILELLGPAATLFKNAGTAIQALATGKPGEAKVLLPSAMQNLAKGVDMVETGAYRDSKGKKVMDVDTVDAFAKMVGFQPANVARENRIITQNMQDIAMQKVSEDAIASRWAQGIVEKNPEMIKDAREHLMQWNKDNPELKVLITPAQIINRVKAMKMTREERFVKSAPKEIRGAVRQELREARP